MIDLKEEVLGPPAFADPKLELRGMVKDEPVTGLELVAGDTVSGLERADVDKVEVIKLDVVVRFVSTVALLSLRPKTT